MYRSEPMAVGNRLTNMEFDEISLVTRPANQLSKVVLFKSDTNTENGMTDEQTEDTNDISKMGYGKKSMKKMPPMMEDEMEDEDEDEMEKKKMKKDDDIVDLPSEVYEYIEALEAANAEMEQALSKYEAAVQQADREVDILKSADPAIVAIVKAAEERAVAAETIAKAERNFRLEREFIGKAAEFSSLPIVAEDFGRVLKGIAETAGDELLGAVMTVLSAANEAISTGNMFAELGKSVAFDNDSSLSEVNKAAKRLMESNPSLTHEQAVSKAVSDNPTLYHSYLRGN